MNPYRVRALFPSGDELDRLRPVAVKQRVEEIVGAAINELTRDGRELDDWERTQLATAIAFLHAGLFHPALATTWWALMSSSERTSNGTLHLPAAMTRFPTAKFQQALAYAQHAPLGPFANQALDRRAWIGRLAGVFKK